MVDEVLVSLANYNPATRTLTVKAASRDKLVPPTLSVPAFAAPNTLNASGAVVLPLPNLDTIPPMTVQVVSSHGGSATAQVSVATPPAAPLAVDDSATTPIDTAVSISVLANDSSAGTIDPASVAIVTAPASGATAVAAANGTVLYTPTAGFSGSETFSYTVSDSFTQVSNAAIVTVTVHAPPVALPDSATAAISTTVNINVIANDVASGSSINSATVSIVSPATCGTTSILTNGTVDFTAPATLPAAPGTCSFSYVVHDTFAPSAISNVATVTITIASPPTITINALPASIDLGTPTLVNATAAGAAGYTQTGLYFSENNVFLSWANPGSTSITWTPATAGARTLTATAYYAGLLAPVTTAVPTAVTINGTVLAPASITVPANNTTGSYTVSWAASATTGVTYTLEESTDPTFGTSTTVSTGGTALSASITGKIGGTYYYRVRAVKAPMTPSAWVGGQIQVILPSTMLSPSGGFIFTGSTQLFNWTNTGATAYTIHVGTTGAGSNNIGVFPVVASTATSVNATGLPVDGSIVYVRLWSLIFGVWQFNDYQYTAYTAPLKATMLPSVPATFTSSTQLFSWTNTGAAAYTIHVGTTGAGSNNIGVFPVVASTATSVNATGLPIDGSIVYVRLWTLIAGVWQFNDYQYTAYTAPLKATMLPSVPATFTSSTQLFSWTNTGAAAYTIHVGTTGAGSNNIGVFPVVASTATSVNATGLPIDGSIVYVRLWTKIAGVWQFNDYQYTAATAPAKATMLPSVPATLTGTTQLFSWTNTGATAYTIHVGTTGAGSNNIGVFPLFATSATSANVTTLPANGTTVFVRLWTQILGVWQFNDYSYFSNP